MVSFTAAKTRRIFDVSVACVRLDRHQLLRSDARTRHRFNLLRIKVQVRTINLIESPQQILRRSIDIVAARVVREVVAERRLREFRSE